MKRQHHHYWVKSPSSWNTSWNTLAEHHHTSSYIIFISKHLIFVEAILDPRAQAAGHPSRASAPGVGLLGRRCASRLRGHRGLVEIGGTWARGWCSWWLVESLKWLVEMVRNGQLTHVSIGFFVDQLWFIVFFFLDCCLPSKAHTCGILCVWRLFGSPEKKRIIGMHVWNVELCRFFFFFFVCLVPKKLSIASIGWFCDDSGASVFAFYAYEAMQLSWILRPTSWVQYGTIRIDRLSICFGGVFLRVQCFIITRICMYTMFALRNICSSEELLWVPGLILMSRRWV